jgi:hypothetical protein
MRKLLLFAGALLATALITQDAFATSWSMPQYSAMPARAATIDSPDAVFFNPAGLVKMKDGVYTDISGATVFKKYEVKNKASFNNHIDTAPAPLVPSAALVYKKDKGALFAGVFIPGGGGGANYTDYRGFGSLFTGMAGFDANQLQLLSNIGWYDPANPVSPGFNYGKVSTYWLQVIAGGSFALNDKLAFTGGLTYSIYYYELSMGIKKLGAIEKYTINTSGASGFFGVMLTPNNNLALTLLYSAPTIAKGSYNSRIYNYSVPAEESLSDFILAGINVRPSEKVSIQAQCQYEFSGEKKYGTRTQLLNNNVSTYSDPFLYLRNGGTYTATPLAYAGGGTSGYKGSNVYSLGLGVEIDLGKIKPMIGGKYKSKWGYPRAAIAGSENPLDGSTREWSAHIGAQIKATDNVNVNIGFNRIFGIKAYALYSILKTNKQWWVIAYGIQAKI